MSIGVVRLDSDLALPSIAHEGDAGLDLVARDEVLLRSAGGRAIIRTGIALALEQSTVGLIVPRSGLSVNHGVTVLNSPGVIDSGYRGEVVVVMVNLDPAVDFQISRGDRIAQLLIVPIASIQLIEVTALPPSPRGRGGLGSSGR